MATVTPRQRLSLLLLSFFLLAEISHAAEVQTELEKLKRKMEKERQGITKVQRKEGSVLQGLEKIEEEMERKSKELKKTDSRLNSILADLQKTEEEVRTIDSSLSARRELLKRRIRALYKWQRGGSPFILLNGGFSVGDLMQRRRYLELTLAYDRKLVSHLLEESALQGELKKELANKRGDVDRQRRALVKVQESIRLEREKKREILTSLRLEKEVRVRALKELEQAAHRLQKMMDEITRKSAAPPPASGVGFEASRGKLDLPVRGEVMGGFGKTRHPEFSAELYRKGIDIKASLGEEIRSVEGGTVVFADRFSGYGKMMIIDHGQRYYTIYAHLSDLFKGAGEAVQKGEPIALVGESNSLVGARLYFEIRKDGKPLDPLPWFKK
jgi:septal ring factor EnvC (AmiA/AmiB activator)